ncbi:MAG: tetratricopeptide repeat protein [Syntrophobacteraceae bacterium]
MRIWLGIPGNKARVVFGTVFTALLLSWWGAGVRPAWGATLQNIRIGYHPGFTRLVFDMEGERPSRVGPAADGAVVIEFPKLDARVQPRSIRFGASSSVAGVELAKGDDSPRVTVRFRSPGSTVKQQFMGGATPGPGRYRLVLDVLDAQGPPAAKTEAGETEKPQEPAPRKPESPDPKGSGATAPKAAEAEKPKPPGGEPAKESQKAAPPSKETVHAQPSPGPSPDQLFNIGSAGGEAPAPAPSPRAAERSRVVGRVPIAKPIEEADKAFREERYADAYDLYQMGLDRNPSGQDRVNALYGLADSYFMMHQDELDQLGGKVADLYANAIKASPKAPQAPLAIYRCGVATEAAGSDDRAIKYFDYLVNNYPNIPLAGKSWVAMGEIHFRKKSFGDAMLSFNSALLSQPEKEEKAAAYYGLGKIYSILNEHEKAVAAMRNSLNEDPYVYRNHPDLLKYYGESLFSLRQYEESQKYLLWSLNLDPETLERDLILARISETLANEGEDKLVKKLQAYIQSKYPDSEGSAISRIRKAEALEGKDPKSAEAGAIYRELAAKKLSDPLAHLVDFKIASWEWRNGNFEKSLARIDEALKDRKEGLAYDEFSGLRDKVILDWTKQTYDDKDYVGVIRMYMENKPVFGKLQSPEIDMMLGDCYTEIKVYPDALDHYRRALDKGVVKDRDAILFKMANGAFQVRDFDKAAEYALQVNAPALETQKTDLLGQIAYMQGQYPKVVEYFGKLFSASNPPEDVVKGSLPIYCESLMKVGKFDDALNWIQKGIAGTDNGETGRLAQLHLMESQCYVALKQPKKAIETLEAVIPTVGEEELKSRLNYELSNLYLQDGQKDKAVAKLQEMISTSQAFWKSAAQQQLNYLQMQNGSGS